MRENGVSSLVYTNEKCQGCNRCISVCPVLTSNYSVKSGEGQRIEVHGENKEDLIKMIGEMDTIIKPGKKCCQKTRN